MNHFVCRSGAGGSAYGKNGGGGGGLMVDGHGAAGGSSYDGEGFGGGGYGSYKGQPGIVLFSLQ